jgi:hypothetical protein
LQVHLVDAAPGAGAGVAGLEEWKSAMRRSLLSTGEARMPSPTTTGDVQRKRCPTQAVGCRCLPRQPPAAAHLAPSRPRLLA